MLWIDGKSYDPADRPSLSLGPHELESVEPAHPDVGGRLEAVGRELDADQQLADGDTVEHQLDRVLAGGLE